MAPGAGIWLRNPMSTAEIAALDEILETISDRCEGGRRGRRQVRQQGHLGGDRCRDPALFAKKFWFLLLVVPAAIWGAVKKLTGPRKISN